MAGKKKRELPKVWVPEWLVEQFKVTGNEEPGESPIELKEDQVQRFQVGMFHTKGFGRVRVEFEAASGQSNWWNTINVFDSQGHLVGQSEPGFDLLGDQEYHLDDGTVIEFEVLVEPKGPPPREWSPRKKLSGPTMGLDTPKERQHAKAMAIQMFATAQQGDTFDRAVAYGYFMAIRDLAVDEGAGELAGEMEKLMEQVKK